MQVSVCGFTIDFGDKFSFISFNRYIQKANLAVFFHLFGKLNTSMLVVEMA